MTMQITQGDPTVVLKTTQLVLAIIALLAGWIVSLVVLSWRASKWVNGVGGRVDKLELDAATTGALVGRLEMDARTAAADRAQIHDRIARVEKAIDVFEQTQRSDTDRVLQAIGEVRERVIRVETILEEREQ